ncbi:MAG: hypothetical protein ACXWDO_06385 [Bacteroidia bacterium]
MQTIRGFENLNEQEQQLLVEVPVMITFLIAGSDNDIDVQERDWAERLVEIRSMKNDSDLVEYYNQVERSWDASFHRYAELLHELADPAKRGQYIAEQLAKCNDIFPKLNNVLAGKLYDGFRSFSRQIALSSGGILGIGAISPQENQWVSLKMIKNPAQ